MPIEICLVEPEIPANTGNIARTCVVTGSPLHLCEPLGFVLDDKRIKRAGLDYWFELDLKIWPSLEACLAQYKGPIFYATTKGGQCYTDVALPADCLLVFGKESRGLPESLLQTHPERCVRIPMGANQRSLNLSNAVAVMAYEALRQNGFAQLERTSDYLEHL